MSTVVKSRSQRLLSSLSTNPGYTLMRVFARFSTLRVLVPKLRGLIVPKRESGKYERQTAPIEETMFPDTNIDEMVKSLNSDGVAFGLKLPDDVISEIREYAEKSNCYADRNPAAGFRVSKRSQAEEALGKEILVAQYFNTVTGCEAIARLARDPVLNRIAQNYLESAPTFVGANLWWTFPVNASSEDRSRHAHLFHRDVDDFKFFKFFFYLTDVEAGDGGHVCVLGSQGTPPAKHFLDHWNVRRYADQEIEQRYAPDQVREITGQAGEGFAEDTWCIHKGQTPVKKPRLLLQIQFALFDYGAMHDRRDEHQLQELV